MLTESERPLEIVGGSRDDVNSMSSPTRRAAAARSIGSGFHRPNVAADDGSDEPRVDLLPAHEDDIGGFHHGVRRPRSSRRDPGFRPTRERRRPPRLSLSAMARRLACFGSLECNWKIGAAGLRDLERPSGLFVNPIRSSCRVPSRHRGNGFGVA